MFADTQGSPTLQHQGCRMQRGAVRRSKAQAQAGFGALTIPSGFAKFRPFAVRPSPSSMNPRTLEVTHAQSAQDVSVSHVRDERQW